MAKQKQQDNHITLNSGVVLEIRRVGAHIVMAATRRIKDPEPPMQDIGKGRLEPNPMHPAYVAELEEMQLKRVDAIYDAALWLGTKLVSKPDDMPAPDSDWTAEYAYLGIEIPEDRQGKYIAWLKYVATYGDEVELANLIKSVRAGSVVTEEEVATAADGFPGDAQRGADLEGATE